MARGMDRRIVITKYERQSCACTGRYSAEYVLQISGVCLLFFSLCLPLPVPYPLSSPSLVLYPDNSSCFGLSAQSIQLRTAVGSLLGSPLLYKSLENSLLSLSFLM